jgi:hypothetical protein
MAANVEAMVREGINAVKAGNKEEGRALLMKAVELDPYHEEGWLWLSGVVEAPDDQRTCLENVLSINPNNERARQGVAYLTGTPVSSAPEPPPAAPAPAADSTRAPTSVEWDMPATETSSASNTWRPANEPSPAEYDDWVSNLNLQTGQDESDSTSSPFSVPAFASASPFLGIDDLDADPDDDLFGDGPFSSAPVVEVPPPAPAPEPSFAFQQPPAFKAAPKEPPAAPSSKPSKQKKSKSAPRTSPSVDDGLPTELTAVDDFFQGLEEEKAEESELFGYIPKEIKATRLPGTRERTPILLVAAAVLLVILNVAAAVLVVDRLLTPA